VERHTNTATAGLDEVLLPCFRAEQQWSKLGPQEGFKLSFFFCFQSSHQPAFLLSPPALLGCQNYVTEYITRGQHTCFYTKLSFSPHSRYLFIIHATGGQVTHFI